MSITSALYSGISGLSANGEAMSVIGNNLSNINTTGFKQARMLFSDMLSSTISGGSQVGRGVQFQSVENQFSQGSFETTESATDLAIQGDPFFVLQNASGRYYSRAGAFHVDKDKILVNPDGYQVLGYGIIQATGLSDGNPQEINLTNFATNPPSMTAATSTVANLDSTQSVPGTTTSTRTGAVTFGGNLNSAAAVGATAIQTVNVYDDAGVAHVATVTFTKTAVDNWSWSAAVAGATAGSPVAGTITYTGAAFTSQTPLSTASQSVTLNGSSQPFTFDLSTMTQNAAASAVTASADGAANTAAWDPTNPVTTSNFSTSLSIYDSQGNSHTVTTYFRKTGANAWDWHAIIPDVVAGTLGSTANPVDGTLTFDTTGNLTAQTTEGAAGYPAQTLDFGASVSAQPVTFNFNIGATTQYASPSIVTSQTQDGYSQGSLVKVTVDDKGYVSGVYSNGQQKKIAQVALAKFSAPLGLSKVGGNLFEETLSSGQVQLVNANSPGVGKILSNSLEQSNVDMAAQFVKMITIQRGYSANSKTVTTTDDMLQELINLKR